MYVKLKIIFCFKVCLLCLIHFSGAQNLSTGNYSLKILYDGKDSTFQPAEVKVQQQFNSDTQTIRYIKNLPSLFAAAGYPVASVDSFWQQDTAFFAKVYLGEKFKLISLSTKEIESDALEKIGFLEKTFANHPLNIFQIQKLQYDLIKYYENSGYPFASVYLDSIHINEGLVHASLKADKSVRYKIDSIRVFGDARISKIYLQKYLGIMNSSFYDGSKLSLVDKKISDLPFLQATQPSDVSLLGSGSLLNLYLKPRKSSQINFIVGFLPDPVDKGKLQLTGDVNLNLKNLLGKGEGILLKWQQLQRNSPRLNLGFNIPYILKSSFGIDFLFDLFKKDSSFLQVNGQLGLQYAFSSDESGKLFVQFQNTGLLAGAIDTNTIKFQKQLPDIIDVKAVNVGLQYDFLKTNYRFNPKKGWEGFLNAAVGTKTISRNQDILSIKDPSYNYSSLYDSIQTKSYQLRVRLSSARYVPIGKMATLRLSVNAGIYSSPDIFRNDLFQIGGFRLLRGFDEESIYANRYIVPSAEFRYLVDLNSYLFLFTDYGLVNNKLINSGNRFFGAGIGIVLETKVGLLNISYAAGKRNDIPFNLREASKLHFGYVNYF